MLLDDARLGPAAGLSAPGVGHSGRCQAPRPAPSHRPPTAAGGGARLPPPGRSRPRCQPAARGVVPAASVPLGRAHGASRQDSFAHRSPLGGYWQAGHGRRIRMLTDACQPAPGGRTAWSTATRSPMWSYGMGPVCDTGRRDRVARLGRDADGRPGAEALRWGEPGAGRLVRRWVGRVWTEGRVGRRLRIGERSSVVDLMDVAAQQAGEVAAEVVAGEVEPAAAAGTGRARWWRWHGTSVRLPHRSPESRRWYCWGRRVPRLV
jgi:hypothetical protein